MTQEKPTLLLVENDPLSLSLYDRELNSDYSIVNCATDGEAQLLLENAEVALIILEPGSGNGWAWNFLEQIKKDQRTASIPVIFCSVLDEKKKGLEHGASVYLVKPVYANILRQHIQQLLGN